MSLSIRLAQAVRTPIRRRTLPADKLAVAIAAIITAALHLATAGRYDVMRNELYFIACGRHFAFGYADQPPLVPWLAALTQAAGLNVWLLRLPAAIAAIALVPLCAMLAREVGGNRRAVVVAAFAAATSPALAGVTTTLTTATFEPLCWTAIAFFATRAVLREERRAMLWAGAIAGVAMEAKYGAVMWLVPMAIGILVTPARIILHWRETWIGALLAVAIAAPSLIWQAAHGWPFLEIVGNHSQGDLTGGTVRFAIGQILAVNPVLAPLWLAGVVAPFVSPTLKPVRFLAIAFLGATAIDIATGGKDYYLFGAYPAMFAIGAVVCGALWAWAVGAWLAASLANFLLVAPIVFPLLPPGRLFELFEHSHLRPAPDEKAAIGAPLTQVFSDEFGWRALERRVAAVWRRLPASDRQGAAIYADNYGEAAAIDVYGRKDGLPTAISGDNQYYLWGPRGADGRIIVVVNGDPAFWRTHCASLRRVATFGVPLAMPYERNRPIMLCGDLKGGLTTMWPALKRFGA